MEPIDDETLMAYADGELPAAERARVDRALARDAALRERLAIFAGTSRLLAPLDDTLAEPLPPSLEARARTLLEAAQAPADAGASTPSTTPAASRGTGLAQSLLDWLFGSPRGFAAAAATFVLGGLIGLMAPAVWRAGTAPQGGDMPPQASVAAGGDALLARALAASPSGAAVTQSDPAGQRSLTPLASLRADDGSFCREYLDVRAPSGPGATGRATRGLACLEADGSWLPRVTVAEAGPPPGESASGYRPASGGLAEFDALVSRLAPGEPLSAEEEAAAIAGGWTGGRTSRR